MINRYGRAPAIAAALALIATLGGCREAEQGRPLDHEKGVYGGEADEPLTPEARDALRERVKSQGRF